MKIKLLQMAIIPHRTLLREERVNKLVRNKNRYVFTLPNMQTLAKVAELTMRCEL